MQKKSARLGVVAAICMLILIFDGKTAVSGAQQGLNLCMKALIPSLFPFLFLSAIIQQSGFGGTNWIGSLICKLFDLPEAAESLLIPAFLGGYPVGALAATELYQAGSIDKGTAERMLSFCSNAGPAFLFGVVAFQLNHIARVWELFVIQILSAFTTASVIRTSCPIRSGNNRAPKSIVSILEQTIHIMSLICGWVVMFRIVLAFLDRWCLWIFPKWTRVAIAGILELSNGCAILNQIADENLRFLIASALLSFGGICVLLQTVSVCTPLSLRFYLKGKLLQTLFSLLLAVCCCMHLYFVLPVWGVMLVIRANAKNRGRIIKESIV